MVLKCPKCGKKFKDKSRYNNHLANVQCDKVYKCNKCNQVFTLSTNLDRHLKDRKTPCVNEETHVCDCGKEFSTKSNLTRHKIACTNKSDVMIAMIQNLTDKIDKLENKSTNTTIINDNRSINITYETVVLKPYGCEDLEKLDIEAVKKLLMNNPEKYAHTMIEMMHTNPEILENHNIYYKEETDEIMVYTHINNKLKWEPRPLEIAAQELTEKSIRYLTSHPIAQNIKAGSIEETKYTDNMYLVTKQKKWNTANDLEEIKRSLQLVTHNEGFLNMVSYQGQ